MIKCGDYYWEVLLENDNSEVYRIQLGDIGEDTPLTAMYGKNTFSVREFNTTFTGGTVIFMELPFEDTPKLIESILKAHKLSLMPLYKEG